MGRAHLKGSYAGFVSRLMAFVIDGDHQLHD
jgi:hypothetical protein